MPYLISILKKLKIRYLFFGSLWFFDNGYIQLGKLFLAWRFSVITCFSLVNYLLYKDALTSGEILISTMFLAIFHFMWVVGFNILTFLNLSFLFAPLFTIFHLLMFVTAFTAVDLAMISVFLIAFVTLIFFIFLNTPVIIDGIQRYYAEKNLRLRLCIQHAHEEAKLNKITDNLKIVFILISIIDIVVALYFCWLFQQPGAF